MIRNHTTSEGAELGRTLAKWCDDAEPKARLKFPELPPRCNSCACRQGPHIANASPFTQMDFLKCLMEGHEFYCHEPARRDQFCSGWAMFMLAKDAPDFIASVPWRFSNEPLVTEDPRGSASVALNQNTELQFPTAVTDQTRSAQSHLAEIPISETGLRCPWGT